MLGYTFRKGLIDGLPIGIGYLSVSFAFGIFAVGSGLHIFDALLLSMSSENFALALGLVQQANSLLRFAPHRHHS